MRLYEDVKKDVIKYAVEDFADHQIVIIGAPTKEYPDNPTIIKCSKPGTVIHSFTVVLASRVICVWGDIGDWIIYHNNTDPFKWVSGAIDSPSYLIGKIVAGEKEEFYPDEAIELLNRWLSDDCPAGECPYERETVESVYNQIETPPYELSEEKWVSAWIDEGDDDPPNCNYPTEGAMLLVEALKCLVRLIPKLDNVSEVPNVKD